MLSQAKLKDLKFYLGNPIINLIQGKLFFSDDNVRNQGTILALISIPSNMDIRETFDYFRGNLKHLHSARVLKTEFARHYTIVLQFLTPAALEEFYEEYKGRVFNLIENDPIVLKRVSKVSTDHFIQRKRSYANPEEKMIEIGKEEPNSEEVEIKVVVVEEKPEAIFSLTERQKTFEEEQSGMRLTEKESLSFKDCPICLDTFSESEPSIIILCSHKFHLKCLKDWSDQTCPVCRYQQFPFELTFCENCDVHQDLWCCIICGFIGCGGKLPVSGHIHEHAVATNHIYSKPIIKDLSSRPKGIWDHSKSDYIHSIIYSTQQQSLVAVEEEPNKEKAPSGGKGGKKANDIDEEINKLISSQLDNQRRFYEAEVRDLEAYHTKCLKDNQTMCQYIQTEISEIEQETEALNKAIEEAKRGESDIIVVLTI
jgi:hypothetical protein